MADRIKPDGAGPSGATSSVFLLTFECESSQSPREDDPREIEAILETIRTGEEGACPLLVSGSGTVVAAPEFGNVILTNAHVVLAASGPISDDDPTYWVAIGLTESARSGIEFAYLGRTLEFDPTLDLALVEPAYTMGGEPIDRRDVDLPALPLAASTDELDLEDPVRLIGYPGVGGYSVTVIESRVAGFLDDPETPELGEVSWIKTNPAAGPGVSGGTAVNEAGEVVGVPTAGYQNSVSCTDYDGNGEIEIETGECTVAGSDVQLVRPVEAVHAFIDSLIDCGEECGETNENGGGAGTADSPKHRDPSSGQGGSRRGDEEDETAVVNLSVSLIDEATGDPIEDGLMVVLPAGMTYDDVDFAEAQEEGFDWALATATSDDDGYAGLAVEVEIGAEYTVLFLANGYYVAAYDGVLADAPTDDLLVIFEVELETPEE